ncbi:MAG: hypothetical protein AB7F19_01905 [Candidatus Babeliales bacterium]
MKFAIWNNSYKLAVAILVLATTAVCNPAVAGSWRETFTGLAKKTLMSLPVSAQKHIAGTLTTYSTLSEATEWRLKLLVDDFLDTNNMRPFSYYVDEFTQIIDENPEFFKALLFEHALRDDTPDKDEVIIALRAALERAKHMRNVIVIKSIVYKPISKFVRKNTKIPTDKDAEAALNYHVGLNKG